MSKSNLKSIALCLILVSSASVAWGQTEDRHGPGPMNSINAAAVNDGKTVDLTLPSVSDPAAVDMLFREGEPIAAILEGLKEKGFHIRYKEKHFQPTMTLLSFPESTVIDDVLREILDPWNFRVYRSPLGHLVVTPNKKKATPAPRDETHEALRKIVHPSKAGD